MKKTGYFILALLALVSCQTKEYTPVEEGLDGGVYKIVAKLSDETRVSITDGGKASWQSGDKIALYDGSSFVTFNLTDPATGEFSGPAGSYTGLAVYPADGVYAWSVDAGNLIVDLPAAYTYAPGQTSAPMIAKAGTGETTFYFTAVSGLFKFSFSNVPDGVDTFRFATSEKVNGSFNLGVPAPGTTICEIDGAANDAEKAITVTIPAGLHADDMVFYIPAPVTNAGRKYAGFAVSLSAYGVPSAEVSSSKTWELARHQMQRMKNVDCHNALPDRLYMVGDCLDKGWSFDVDQSLAKVAPGIYRASDVLLKTSGGFKIYFNADWSASWLSVDAENSGYTSETGFADLNLIGGEFYKAREGVGDTQIYLNGRGYYAPFSYDFEVNLNTRKFNVTPHKIYYVGGCVDSWGLTESQMLTQTSPGVYECDLTIKDVEDWNGLQFYSMPEYWGASWAADVEHSTHSDIILTTRKEYKDAHGDTDPQFYPLQLGYTPGDYHLTLNFNTMRITLN